MENFEEKDQVECPLCLKFFPHCNIHTHVEICLDKSEGNDSFLLSENDDCEHMPEKKIKLKSTNEENTKMKLAAWGSLSCPHFNKQIKGNLQTRNKRGLKSPNQTGAPIFKNVGNTFKFKLNGSYANEFERKSHEKSDISKNLFQNSTSEKTKKFLPLAERMRPKTFFDYIGQEQVLKKQTILRTLLDHHDVPSMIFWGPPGCGKTSLAHIIANNSKQNQDSRFVQLSATSSGIAEVKEIMIRAKNDQVMFNQKTILFIDEIHRFNKLQQDAFLPCVENGTIVLIGATTENPSFSLNNALLSRCQVIVLQKLLCEDIEKILTNALKMLNVEILEDDLPLRSSETINKPQQIFVEKHAISMLANLCDGDARIALNGLQMALQSETEKYLDRSGNLENVDSSRISGSEPSANHGASSNGDGLVIITSLHVKEALQRSHLLYDKKGDEHYNCISALHKSMRGSDASASLYWLARMLEGGEDPLYIARRLIRFSSEDIGLADPLALNQAVATYQGCHFIGMPECEVLLAQCVVYLCRAPKSIEIYEAYAKAKGCIKNHEGPLPGVSLHLRNAPTKLMKDLGYGKDYKYNPTHKEPVIQNYLPEELQHLNFFK